MASLAQMTKNANAKIKNSIDEFDVLYVQFSEGGISKEAFLEESYKVLDEGIRQKGVSDSVELNKELSKRCEVYISLR